MYEDLTPEQQQVIGLLRNRQRNINPKSMGSTEIEQLLEAAAVIGQGRAEGLDDGAALSRFIGQLRNQANQRPELRDARAAAALKQLKDEKLDESETVAKSEGEIIAEREAFGFGDEKEARLGVGDARKGDYSAGLRAQIRKVRKQKQSKKRDARLKKLEDRLKASNERQMLFDAGVGRVVNKGGSRNWDPAVEEEALKKAAQEQGRTLNFQGQRFDETGEPLELAPNIRGRAGVDLFGREQLARQLDLGEDPVYQVQDFVEGPSGELLPAADDLDRERGTFVLVPDGNGGRKRMWREGGKFFNTPDEAAANRRPDFAEGVFKSLPLAPVDREAQKRAKLRDIESGRGEVQRFLRFEAGNLTPAEMDERARLLAGRMLPETGVVGKTPIIGIPTPESGLEVRFPDASTDSRKIIDAYGFPTETGGVTPLAEGFYRTAGKNDDPVEFDIRPQRDVVRRPGATPQRSLTELISLQRQELEAKKRAGQEGAILAQQQANLGKALREAEQNLMGNMTQPELRGPTVTNLGGRYNRDADMGIQFAGRPVTDVATVSGTWEQGPDVNLSWLDKGNNTIEFEAPLEQDVNVSEALNAPKGSQGLVRFLTENQFEDRGAQFFGDEDVVRNMNDTGSGGGIQSVDIGGAFRDFENRIAKKYKKGVRIENGAQLLDALKAVVDLQVRNGKALGVVENDEFKVTNRRGVAEGLNALGYTNAQQKLLANAVIQNALAVSESGRMPASDVPIGYGVDDPRKGGDSLKIKKDTDLQSSLRKMGIEGEALMPFIGLLYGEKNKAGNYNNVVLDKKTGEPLGPIEVREFQERRNRSNRIAKVKRAQKQGKKAKFTRQDFIDDATKVRSMMEGNIIADINNQIAQAEANNAGRNVMGQIVPPEQMMDVPRWAEQRPAKLNIKEGVKRVRPAELLPPPQRRGPSSVVQLEESDRPDRQWNKEGFVPQAELERRRAEKREATVKRRNEFRDRAYNRIMARDAAIAGGGVLASILGLNALSGNNEEEEQF